MAKRLIDSSLFEKDWFIDSADNEKVLWIYLFTKCDVAGVYDPNLRVMSAVLKKDYTVDDILRIFKGRIIRVGDKLLLTTFLEVQGYLNSPKLKIPIEKALAKVGLTLDTLKEKCLNFDKNTVSNQSDTARSRSINISIDKKEKQEQVSAPEVSEGRFNPKVQEVITKWNAFAVKHGLSGNIILTGLRTAWIIQRLREQYFDFDKILSGLEKGKWGLGKDGGWKITLDKIIQDDSYYPKLIEANTITDKKAGIPTTVQSDGKGFIHHICSCNYEASIKLADLENNRNKSTRCVQCQRPFTGKMILDQNKHGTSDFSLKPAELEQSPEEIKRILEEALK